MNQRAHRIVTACLAILMLLALPLSAADLAQAKAQGWVGEQMNGYLGLVRSDAPADVKSLVAAINHQRRAEYERIARKNGVSSEDVARLAAQKVISQTPPGQYVQTPSGWQRR